MPGAISSVSIGQPRARVRSISSASARRVVRVRAVGNSLPTLLVLVFFFQPFFIKGATRICVGHDQVEAMTLADRFAVFDVVRIKQVGTPVDRLEHPVHRLVAGCCDQSRRR